MKGEIFSYFPPTILKKIPIHCLSVFLMSLLLTILRAPPMTPYPSYSPDMFFTLFNPCVYFTLIPHLLRPGASFSPARYHVNSPHIDFVTHLDLCVTTSALSVFLCLFQIHLLPSGPSFLRSPCVFV